MPYSLTDTVLYFFIYSFCGWLMETVLCSVRERRFINRGFLNGPLCPIYGCGVTLILICLLPVKARLPGPAALPVIFAAGAVLASAVEYITSWLMEKLFHARWWDYSHIKYNLGGRICLPISLAWGALAAFFVYAVQPLFEALVHTLYGVDDRLPWIVAAVLTALFLVDCAVSVRIALTLGNKLEQMEKLGELIRAHLDSLSLPAGEDLLLRLEGAYDRFAEKKKKAAGALAAELRGLSREELADRLRRRVADLQQKRAAVAAGLRPVHKRLLAAFPTMKRRQGGTALEELRQRLRRKGKKEDGEKR